MRKVAWFLRKKELRPGMILQVKAGLVMVSCMDPERVHAVTWNGSDWAELAQELSLNEEVVRFWEPEGPTCKECKKK